MESNNMELRTYVQPETEIVTIGGDSAVMQTITPGSNAEDDDF